jgi:predicted nucleotidyltransferase
MNTPDLSFGFSEDELKIIRGVLRIYTDIDQAKIYGSRAMGNYKSGSDVDIALMGDIEPNTILRVKTMLTEGTMIPYFFDVLNYSKLSNQDLKAHIDKYGKTLYQRNQ